jgi:hypothetical protein
VAPNGENDAVAVARGAQTSSDVDVGVGAGAEAGSDSDEDTEELERKAFQMRSNTSAVWILWAQNKPCN